MRKNLKLFLMFLILILAPSIVQAVSLPDTYSDKVLIYDLTDDKTLQEKNITERSNIASLTKIVTTITAIENIKDLDKLVTITQEMLLGIPYDASVAGLKVGEVYTVRDLLYASILPSGADATQALAYTSVNSISKFVDKMNELVTRIGATNTHFVNTTGYDIENHYSNIEDLLKIIKYSLQNPEFKTIFCTKEKQLKNGKTVKWTVDAYNKMMHLNVDRIIGSKTGYTSKAGLCIAALFESHGHEMLMITLGARPYIYGNFYNLRDALKLIDFIDDNYNEQTLIKSGDVVQTIDVALSKNEQYDIKTTKDIKKFLPNDFDKNNFKIEYDGLENISFMVPTNSKLGKVKYFYEDELILEEDIILEERQQASVEKILRKYWYVVLILVVLIILKIISPNKRKHKKKH